MENAICMTQMGMLDIEICFAVESGCTGHLSSHVDILLPLFLRCGKWKDSGEFMELQMDRCHGAGLGTTILSSGVGVLALSGVSVVFRVVSTLHHCDRVFLAPVVFRWILRVSMGF